MLLRMFMKNFKIIKLKTFYTTLASQLHSYIAEMIDTTQMKKKTFQLEDISNKHATHCYIYTNKHSQPHFIIKRCAILYKNE